MSDESAIVDAGRAMMEWLADRYGDDTAFGLSVAMGEMAQVYFEHHEAICDDEECDLWETVARLKKLVRNGNRYISVPTGDA